MPAGYVTDSDDESDQLETASDDDSEIPGAVQSANYRVYSTWELYQRITKKTIDLSAPYQRDVVWTKKSQSALIDSIFKNKWVPTLLFCERPATTAPDGSKIKARWVCMDGKQRLTSIQLFIDGEIPWYRRPKEPIYFKQSHPPQPSRRLLNESLKDAFMSRGLTAAMYNQLTELQERDIFRLVQEGKPLSPGEKLQASSGLWGIYIADLTSEYMEHNSSKPNGWCQRISNLKRGSDYAVMAQVVFTMRDLAAQASAPPRCLSTAVMTTEISKLSKTPVPTKLKEDVKNVMDIFMEVSTLAPPRTQYTVELRTPDALHVPIQRGRKTMLAPVEMIWIPYMIHFYHSQLSKGKLLEMIEMFKIDIRRKWFNEVKNNIKVVMWIVEWIKTFDVGRLKGKYAGWAVPRPAPQLLPEDNSKSDTSGMHDFAKRSLGTQMSAKREAPSDAKTVPLKKVRGSQAATAASQSNCSPNVSNTSAKVPSASPHIKTSNLPNVHPTSANSNSTSRKIKSTLSKLSTSRPNSQPIPNSGTNAIVRNVQRVSATQRTNSTTNGAQLSSSNGRRPPSGPPPPHNLGPISRSSVLPQATTATRFVPNYPVQSTRPIPIQSTRPIPVESTRPTLVHRPVQHPISHSSSSQPPTNTSSPATRFSSTPVPLNQLGRIQFL